MRALLLKSFWCLTALLPLPAVHVLGVFTGRMHRRLGGRLVRRVRFNLATAFPGMTSRDRETLLRETLCSHACTWLEAGGFWCAHRDRLLRQVRGVEGEERLAAALGAGRGVVLLLPHLGAWELLLLYLGSRHPLTTLYRRPRIEALDDWLRRARERTGGRFVPADATGVRALFEALRRGEAVCVLPDQAPKRGAQVMAPFFGTPAPTMTLASRLIERTGCAVLFAQAERLPGGQGYRLGFLPAPDGVGDPDPLRAATALNAGVEMCVCRAPAQYQWTYRRYRRPAENV